MYLFLKNDINNSRIQHIGIVEQQKRRGKGRDDSIIQFSIQPSTYFSLYMYYVGLGFIVPQSLCLFEVLLLFSLVASQRADKCIRCISLSLD